MLAYLLNPYVLRVQIPQNLLIHFMRTFIALKLIKIFCTFIFCTDDANLNDISPKHTSNIT